jgi:cytochrome c oxidase subunit II
MRAGESGFNVSIERLFDIHPHGVLVHQLPPQVTGDGDQGTRQKRHVETQGDDVGGRLVNAEQPVEAGEREHHHRQNGVTPAGHHASNARDGDQIDQTHGAGHRAAHGAYARKPQAGSRPKEITGPPVAHISADQPQQSGHGKMDQHRVNGVAVKRHPTTDGLSGHGTPDRFRRLENVAGRLSDWALLGTLGALAGCRGPLSTLDPAGPAAQSAAGLWWGLSGFFTLVFVGLIALWWQAMRRDPGEISQEQARRLQNRWILAGGLALPLGSMALILALGIPAGRKMLPLPPAGGEAMVIEVKAHQWGWRVTYPDQDIELTDELHIPTDTPIDIHLTTADVIHSFWVPRLAGKLDTIPGRTNVLRLEASRPGEYRGQCAEFCGINHAHMSFTVTAHPPEEYEKWREETQAHD